MKVLVTGAAGFIGGHLVDMLLKRGDDVVAFDRHIIHRTGNDNSSNCFRSIQSNILDKNSVYIAAENCDAIFHCAAVVGVDAYIKNPVSTMETEEVGLRNVCNAALKQTNKPIVIFCSSSAVYGHAEVNSGLNESAEVAPVSAYGIAKRYAELYLASQYQEYGLKSASFRIFNIYGPRQDDRLVLPRFIANAIKNEPLEINGEGYQTRDFIYVDDVISAMIIAAENIKGCEIINACSGEEISIRSIAEFIVRLTKSSSSILFKASPSQRNVFEVCRSIGSRERFNDLTRTFKSTTLEHGLNKTIEYINKNKYDILGNFRKNET